mmetsp:Transcript_120624/g.240196  ORF Transcript_120624/g.240196 Transcript_120624/m.240196 type:complete len:229 (+) Transcript_120624:33-719(+)
MADGEVATALDSSLLECRFCLEAMLEDGNVEESILSFPCECSTPVHIECLQRWQNVQIEEARNEGQSSGEASARASTCEVCGAALVTSGERKRPVTGTATCRAHGGFGQVALRRVPALSRATRNFTEFSAADGQELAVLEQDASGEFFRVRAVKAPRYREESTVAVAHGWIRHVYLEWPAEFSEAAAAAVPAPRRPPAYATGQRPATTSEAVATQQDGEAAQEARDAQ